VNQAKKNTTKDVHSSSVWMLILGLAVVTIYFKQNFEDPFNTPKLILLLITAGWLFGHILEHYVKQKIPANSLEFYTLVVCLLFTLFNLISLFNTDVFLTGLIGDTQRRNGFLHYFALTVIFLYTSIRFNYFYSLRLIKTSIFIGLTLSFYGLLQISGRDFVKWNNPYNAMISTLGNPNFASALLAVITVILILLLFIKSIHKIYKLVAFVVIFASLTSIFKSNSRQGLLVIVIALLFYLAVYSYFNFYRTRSVVISFAISCFSLLIAGMLQIGPLAEYLYKSSVSVRGYYWKAAYEMFMSKPLTGVGLDSFGSYFKQFREVGYPLNYGFEITSSNAHNVYLQQFSTGGLFVGLSYLLILLLVFIIGILNVKSSDGDEQKTALLLLSGWIGFQAQSLISIDNIGISIWGWVLGGAIIGLRNNSIKIKNLPTVNASSSKGRNTVNLFQPTASVIILVPIIFLSYNLWNLESNMRLVRQYAVSDISDKNTLVYNYAQKVFDNPFADPRYKFQASLYIVDTGNITESYKQIKLLYGQNPRDLDILRWLAEYNKSISNYKSEILYRTRISLLDPWNADNYLMLGTAYKKIGDSRNSRRMLDKIISFATNSDTAKKAVIELG
jgi:putative inorganic carbon (HCO3(-)) transporter